MLLHGAAEAERVRLLLLASGVKREGDKRKERLNEEAPLALCGAPHSLVFFFEILFPTV